MPSCWGAAAVPRRRYIDVAHGRVGTELRADVLPRSTARSAPSSLTSVGQSDSRPVGLSDSGSPSALKLDWAMLAASRSLAGGQLDLRGMLSTDPWGVGSAGYPLLLQTGESNRGVPPHDHQHPHDLFMEVAALYRRAVAKNLGASLYLAPVGEPAVGPVAFPHRPSAANDPLAPISHHWQDGTHITFGLLTGGVFTRTANVEVSWFN